MTLEHVRRLVELAEGVAYGDQPTNEDQVLELARGVLDLERGLHRALVNCAELRDRIEQVRKVVF